MKTFPTPKVLGTFSFAVVRVLTDHPFLYLFRFVRTRTEAETVKEGLFENDLSVGG